MPNFKDYYSQVENYYKALEYSQIEHLFAHLRNQDGLQNLTMPQLVNYLNFNRINYAANQFLLLRNLEKAFNQEDVISMQSRIEEIIIHKKKDLAQITDTQNSYILIVMKVINSITPLAGEITFDRDFINHFLIHDVFHIQDYPTTERTRDFVKASQATKNFLKNLIPQDHITRAQDVLTELEQQAIYRLDLISEIPSIRADEMAEETKSEQDSSNSIIEYNNYNNNATTSPNHTSYMQVEDININGLSLVGSYGTFDK